MDAAEKRELDAPNKKIGQVFEVSACNYPAYEQTDIHARAKKVWSVKFSVYLAGAGGRAVRLTELLKKNSILPERLHNVSGTYAVTVSATGNYISTSTITVDDPGNRFYCRRQRRPPLPTG